MGDEQESVNLKLMTIANTVLEEAARGGYVTRSCESCGKSFGSQKALEIHMRVHANIKPENRSQSQSLNVVADPSEICPVCGRSFRSMKSLFGHMKCHPERQSRGIKDSREKNKRVNCNHEFELMKNSLPWNWSVTGKRGRKSISSGTTATSTTTEEKVDDADKKDVLDAVEVLLSLSSGNPFFIPNQVTNSNSVTNHLSPEIGSTNFKMKEDDHAQLNMDVLPIINQEQMTITTKSEMKGKKKLILKQDESSNKKIHVDSVISCADQKYFKCDVCNKCFSTHLALGGHKSSHNKHITKIENPTNCSHINIDTTNNNAQHSSNLRIKIKLKTSSSIINSTSLHQCKIYSKNYSTGQALGGHMRAHFIENPENSSSQVISSDETSGQTIRIVFPFDLNDPPPIDDEGD